jgi:hypothetical protein
LFLQSQFLLWRKPSKLLKQTLSIWTIWILDMFKIRKKLRSNVKIVIKTVFSHYSIIVLSKSDLLLNKKKININ